MLGSRRRLEKAFPSYWRVNGVIGSAYEDFKGAVLKAPGEPLGALLSRHISVPKSRLCASTA